MNHSPFCFRTTALALFISAATLSPAWAASHSGAHGAHGTHGDHAKPTAQAAAADMTDAEVRKVDREGGKLTLKHADIKSLDMPAMTMVFVVKDKAMLDKLKAGDKIRFKAINEAGKYTVTEMQMAQ